MSANIDDTELEALLARYLTLPPDERLGFVRAVAQQQPQYAEHLAEIHWESLDSPPDPPPHPEDERLATLLNDGYRRRIDAANANRPMASLLKLAAARGIRPGQLATELRLGIDVVMKLDGRMIRAETIPSALVERLTKQLQASAAQVIQALTGAPPTTVQGGSRSYLQPQRAFYSSARPPTSQRDEAFQTALERSPTTSADDRAYWRGQQ